MQPRHVLGSIALAATIGCATTSGVTTSRGPDVEVPIFSADDPRVKTAGFVRETSRLHREEDGVRLTLMAFAVGKTLTLGAMVRGTFDGLVRWKIGGRRLSFAFDTTLATGEIPVEVEGEAQKLTAQRASFRGTSWANIELPVGEWIEDGTPLQLVFLPRVGTPRFLPDDGYHYRVRLSRR